ncbi:MAG: type II secretion system protein [Candidatus Omnitrophica bacterium]|nr:type II secretion system protein [Candidatus Omnitrophota bacterium]
MKIKFFKTKAGFTLVELMTVTTIVTSLPLGAYKAVRRAKQVFCRNNLNQIRQALTIFMIENNDRLPSACFYPEDSSDPKSIANILYPYLRTRKVFICPSLPGQLRKKGITYIWNDQFNNQNPDHIPNRDKKWLMMEMTAVSEKIPPPHSKGYNILYLDGHIETKPRPPDLRREVK